MSGHTNSRTIAGVITLLVGALAAALIIGGETFFTVAAGIALLLAVAIGATVFRVVEGEPPNLRAPYARAHAHAHGHIHGHARVRPGRH